MTEREVLDLTKEQPFDEQSITLTERPSAEIIPGAVRTASLEDKKEIATAALQALGTEANETRKDLAVAAIQTLPPEAQEELITQLRPSQQVTDRVWQLIVGSFAIVFIGSTAGLIVGTFLLSPEQIQILLTVVTTVAGVLAGFMAGRAQSNIHDK